MAKLSSVPCTCTGYEWYHEGARGLAMCSTDSINASSFTSQISNKTETTKNGELQAKSSDNAPSVSRAFDSRVASVCQQYQQEN